MAPIRIAIIGLAAKDVEQYSTGTWGVQHFRAIKNSPHYQVTAVCNSSVESAQRAIDFHNIAGAKAYGNVHDLAADKDVEMVAISVNVEKHHQLAKPLLQVKKNLYIEHPVAVTTEEVKELQQIARENNVKVVIGAQATGDPVFRKVAELVRSKAIGEVSTASVTASIPVVSAFGWLEAMKRYLDRDIPDNRVRVIFGHFLAAHNFVLGSLSSMQTIAKTVIKKVPLLGANQEVVNPAYISTAPDTFLIQGITPSGAASSIAWRTTPATVDDQFLRWTISGTEGELELVAAKPGPVQVGDLGATLKLRKWGQKEEVIELEDAGEEQWLKEVPSLAKNIARLYDAFARGKEEDYLTLDEGAEVHRMVEEADSKATWAP